MPHMNKSKSLNSINPSFIETTDDKYNFNNNKDDEEK